VTPSALQAEQWHHALATLHAARGSADVALRIWRQVADGELAALADPGVQAAERREALESAAALLRDPAACPEAALVRCLPWLLAASQPTALAVLMARSLTAATVLPLLPADSDVRWQYLAHLVAAEAGSGAPPDPQLHTELATQLVAAIMRAEPLLRTAVPAGGSPMPRAASRRSSGGGGGGGRLPLRRASSSAGGASARRPSRTSTAALVSGGSLEPWPGAARVDTMRLRLRAHLEQSPACDAAAVLRSLQGSGLHEELVVLHVKVGAWIVGGIVGGKGRAQEKRRRLPARTCRSMLCAAALKQPTCLSILSINLYSPACCPARWATTWPRCACWR
jgi:hypothetical protein